MSDNRHAEGLLLAAQELRDALAPLQFESPVTHVYNPLVYAWEMYAAYVRRFVTGPRDVLFVGMNPGPWGMAQTGVPFGEVGAVSRYLKLAAPIRTDVPVHPKRPIDGLSCRRVEVSGLRLWGLVAHRYPEPDAFFERHFIANYCPLMFLEASGRNRTPAQLSSREREPLQAACDRHLQQVVAVLSPRWVVGIGQYAHGCARRVLGDGYPVLARVTHPSPASPAANRDWASLVLRELREQGICAHAVDD